MPARISCSSSALEETISPAQGQRYVVSRPVWPDGLTSSRAVWRVLTGRSALAVAWNPVPSDFARHKDRATAFHAAWQANVGPAELEFAGREGAPGREELAASAAAGADYVSSRRLLWH